MTMHQVFTIFLYEAMMTWGIYFKTFEKKFQVIAIPACWENEEEKGIMILGERRGV
jgi:hypothetical protein